MKTKDDIKKAAFILFANKGYEATSTNDIAGEVGIKKPSLYSHYKSKSEIYLAILDEQSRHINDSIHQAAEKYKGASTELFLKGMFMALMQEFSTKERLLLWKRTYLLVGAQVDPLVSANTEWNFDRYLKKEICNTLCSRYDHMKEPATFRSFFLSYMLLIQGFMDWLMISDIDDHTLDQAWENYWAGAKDFFLC